MIAGMQKSRRNSNIELLRIAAMMGVVACHYVHGNIGGVENYAVFPGFTWWFVSVVRGFAIPMVNVFVIITGYFMISKHTFSLRKTADLGMTVLFYGLVIFCIESVSKGKAEMSTLLPCLFPIFYEKYWFIKTYIILILTAPFLNKVLDELDYRQYRLLLAVQILIFSVWYSVGMGAPEVNDGYGIIHFYTLYMLGGFVRKYRDQDRLLGRLSSGFCLLVYGCLALFTAALSVFINPFGYSFVTNIIAALSIFLFADKQKPRSREWINRLASFSFDVFFIHGAWLFQFLAVQRVYESKWVLPHLLVTLIVCYAAGVLTGTVRKAVFSVSVNQILGKCTVINKQIDI